MHAKEEYDGDGNLLYKPPPLDEVWLSEPERQERRDALKKQRCRRDVFERQRATDSLKDAPSSPVDFPPGLVVSDDESSNDESDDGHPLPTLDSGSEGDDIWHSDHPTLENEASQPDPVRPTPIVEPISDKIPEAPNIPQEGATL